MGNIPHRIVCFFSLSKAFTPFSEEISMFEAALQKPSLEEVCQLTKNIGDRLCADLMKHFKLGVYSPDFVP